MKNRINFFRNVVSITVSIFFITTPLLTSCGDGGGSTESTSLQGQLEQQGDAADNFFYKFGELLGSIKTLEEEITQAGSDDSEIISKINEKIIPLGEEVSAAGNLMIEMEENIQILLPSQQQIAFVPGTKSHEMLPAIQPSAALTAVVLGVCFVGTMASAAISINEGTENYIENMKKCNDLYDLTKELLPSGLSAEERWEYFSPVWACMDLAQEKLDNANVWTTVGLGFSVFGPKLAPTKTLKLTTEFISFYLDSKTIYVAGTKPSANANVHNFLQNDLTPTADNSDNPDMFLTTVDSNGEFTAPVGEWNLAVYKKGYVRMGTPEGETIQVSEDANNEIEINPVSINEVTEDTMSCSADNGSDDTYPEEDCDDDIDNDGDGLINEDCVTEPEEPSINYVVWIHEDSRTCCSGDFDGVSPYQYHGTEEGQVDSGAMVLETFDSDEAMLEWACGRTVHQAYNWITNWAEIGNYIVTNLPCEANAGYN